MGRMQSLHNHCCCCACSVFSALFGILMASTGVSLVLNYGILDVDTGGLPPELHNEEGKRIVGIILISVGLTSIAISATVSIMYYTVCSRAKPQQVAAASTTQDQKTSNTSSVPSKSKQRPKNRAIQDLQNGARMNGQQGLAPPSNRHAKRHKRKNLHYHSKLPTHREESDDPSFVVRFQGENVTIASNKFINTNNNSRVSGEGTPGTSSPLSTIGSDSTINPSVIITVDTLQSDSSNSVQHDLEVHKDPPILDESISPPPKSKPSDTDIENLVT